MDLEKLKISAILTGAAMQGGKVSADPEDVVKYLVAIYQKIDDLTAPPEFSGRVSFV